MPQNLEPTQYVSQHLDNLMQEELFPLLRISSVSAGDNREDHVEDIREAAAYTHKLFENLQGFEVNTVQPDQGNPLVFAERVVDPSAKTLVIYGHYDVQPAEDADAWVVDSTKLEPFEPQIVNDRLYARGATDDKGQLFTQYVALRYLAETNQLPDCNIVVIAEGDEESGQDSCAEYVKECPEIANADAVFISDSPTAIEGHPAITTSMRGIVTRELAADNIESLIATVRQIHDPNKNSITISGFYNSVEEVASPNDLHQDHAHLGLGLREEEGYLLAQSLGTRPTVNILGLRYNKPTSTPVYKLTIDAGRDKSLHSGIDGGPTLDPGLVLLHVLHYLQPQEITGVDAGAWKNSIENTATAYVQNSELTKDTVVSILSNELGYDRVTAQHLFTVEEHAVSPKQEENPSMRLSFRIAYGQKPETVVNQLESSLPTGVRITERNPQDGMPFYASPDSEIVNLARQAMAKGYSSLEISYETSEVQILANGGTLPILEAFTGTIVLIGHGGPDDCLHAAKESISLSQLKKGTLANIYAIQSVGAHLSQD